MNWWGKLIGGYLGFIIGGPIGALLGAALGHNFDKPATPLNNTAQQRAQAAFFTTTFSVMGHICKADGRVCENEIEIARRVMAQMSLSEAQKQTAMHLFNQGKQADFPLMDVLRQLRQELGAARNIRRMFIEIQCSAAFADGSLHPQEKTLLYQISETIGFPRQELDNIIAAIAAGMHHRQGSAGKSGEISINDARAILGVTKASSRDEIKRAYRRLMSQHHPDKLIARGLPEEMVKMATRRSQEIRQAYDRLMSA